MGDLIICKSLKLRKENETQYSIYNMCWLNSDTLVQSGTGYTQNPIEGHSSGFNFGSLFNGLSDSQEHTFNFFCENGNKLSIVRYANPSSSHITGVKKYNFMVTFSDYINSDNSGNINSYVLSTGISFNFQIGMCIDTYVTEYENGIAKGISIYDSEVHNLGVYIPSVAGQWVTTGSSRILPEWKRENETIIPEHKGFDIFLWAGAGAKDDNSDPYEDGGGSEEGGGEGDFTDDDEPIDFPDLPDISVVDTGFITLFNPSLTQLQNLASYMWSDLFSIDTFKKIVADPMDCILGLSIVPVNVPAGGTQNVTVGNISTGVSMTKAQSQYVAVDCGTLNVKEYWGAYLDYSPYTKIQLYLPYIGTQQLDIDDVMNSSIHVRYHVDILSGSLTCFVKCGNAVLYTYTGQCSISIPVNSTNFTSMITSIASGLVKVGAGIAVGGGAGAVATIATSAIDVAQSKPTISRSGNISGMGGLLAIQTPYLILTRLRQCVPSNQNKYTGYPSYMTVTLSSLKGYTEVDSIHLENVPCTDAELNEIENLLKEGVVI